MLTLEVDIVHPGAAFLCFYVSLQFPAIRILLVVFLLLFHNIGDERFSNDIVSRCRLSDVQPVDNGVDLVSFHLRIDAMLKQSVACLVLELHDALVRIARDLDIEDTLAVEDLVHERTIFGSEVVKTRNIDLVHNQHDGLIGEEGLDGVEEFTLQTRRRR